MQYANPIHVISQNYHPFTSVSCTSWKLNKPPDDVGQPMTQKCTYLLPEILFVLKGFVIWFIIVALVKQGLKKAVDK